MDGIGGRRPGLSRALLGRADDAWERQVYLSVDGLTVICSALEKRARAFGVPAHTIRLLPVGANIDTIRPLDKGMMREKYGLPRDVPIITYVGVNTYDTHLLGLSFVELAKRNRQVLLLLIGTGMPDFDKVVTEAHIKARVIYRGFVPYDQLGEQLACGDIMLLPYTNQPLNIERYPNKIGDYMAAGRPTVTNPTGDLQHLVEQERIGLLAPETPQAFADTVQQLIERPGLAEEIGKHARQVAEQRYSWNALARDLVDFYTELRIGFRSN
jgi:glycosyltransferase involved in cell wall biosynthesis